MSPSNELDGIDFRPFFDMVVGILFVLLILVGALIFFQQAQDSLPGSSAQSQTRRWRLERDRFLERLVADLGAQGLRASADTAGGAVTVLLDGLVREDATGGLPELEAGAVMGLAGVLGRAVTCVSVPRAAASSCPDTDLLSLDGLSLRVRLGAAPPDATLSRDRAARFLAAGLTRTLYDDAPDLLRASDPKGAPVVGFDSGTLGDGKGDAPGDLALVFSFAPPAR